MTIDPNPQNIFFRENKSKNFPTSYALASVKGPYHKNLNKSCEDAGACLSLPFSKEPIFLGAIADGAGSVPFGREGALLAVKETLLFFKHSYASFSQDTFEIHVRKLIAHIRRLLQKKATEKNVPLSSLASTLLAFCATPSALYFFQVGDGFAAIRQHTQSSAEKVYYLVTLPQKGEHENETYFVTSNCVYEAIKCLVITPTPTFLAMATDGIEGAALKKPEFLPFAPFFAPLESFLEQQTGNNQDASKNLADFLKSPKFQEKSSDDKTLLLVKFFSDSSPV